jgi:hypothetical protein
MFLYFYVTLTSILKNPQPFLYEIYCTISQEHTVRLRHALSWVEKGGVKHS